MTEVWAGTGAIYCHQGQTNILQLKDVKVQPQRREEEAREGGGAAKPMAHRIQAKCLIIADKALMIWASFPLPPTGHCVPAKVNFVWFSK